MQAEILRQKSHNDVRRMLVLQPNSAYCRTARKSLLRNGQRVPHVAYDYFIINAEEAFQVHRTKHVRSNHSASRNRLLVQQTFGAYRLARTN